jgi:hypothetical protein
LLFAAICWLPALNLLKLSVAEVFTVRST